jgi:hypothetical protein
VLTFVMTVKFSPENPISLLRLLENLPYPVTHPATPVVSIGLKAKMCVTSSKEVLVAITSAEVPEVKREVSSPVK